MPHEFTPTRLGTLCVGSVRIWFDVDVQSAAAGYPNSGYEAVGTPIPHPGWTDLSVLPKSSNTYDMGIVVLDGALDPALTAGRYGQVANVGFLNGVDTARGTQDTYFTTVGYGLQERKPQLVNLRIRMYAVSDLVNLRNALVDDCGLMTTNNPGDDRGGNCSGDSGGPILWRNTDIIVAVNSFALNNVCHGPTRHIASTPNSRTPSSANTATSCCEGRGARPGTPPMLTAHCARAAGCDLESVSSVLCCGHASAHYARGRNRSRARSPSRPPPS